MPWSLNPNSKCKTLCYSGLLWGFGRPRYPRKKRNFELIASNKCNKRRKLVALTKKHLLCYFKNLGPERRGTESVCLTRTSFHPNLPSEAFSQKHVTGTLLMAFFFLLLCFKPFRGRGRGRGLHVSIAITIFSSSALKVHTRKHDVEYSTSQIK